jgi:hypothetical protein
MDGFTIAFAVGFGAAITLIVAWLVCLTGEVRQLTSSRRNPRNLFPGRSRVSY